MRRNWLFRFIQLHRRWLPYIVLVGTLSITGLVTGYVHHTATNIDKIRFQNSIQRTQNSIETRLETYVSILRGGAGLISADPAVNREQFRNYVNRLRLAEYYPGVQGIGFTKQYQASERKEIETILQELGSIPLSPSFERSEYYPIIYLEPLDRRNQAALGYDMFTEPTRRAAMERARDAGVPQASGKVTLRQEIDEDKQAGFLIYVPVYAGGGVPGTVAERQANLDGFVYSPFRANDLMEGIFGTEPYPFVAFQIYDGTTPNADSLLYSSRTEDRFEQAGYHPRLTATLRTSIAGRPWAIVYASKPTFDATSSIRLVPYVAIAGVLVSLSLFGITRSLVQAQLAVEKTAFQLRESEYNLQRSHNELERRVEERTSELSKANTEAQVLRERLQFLLSASPAVIFTCKPDSDYAPTFISDNIVALSGYTTDEILADSQFWANHIHPDDTSHLWAERPAWMADEQHIYEYRFFHKAEYYQWLRHEVRLIQDEQGHPIEIVGYVADISDRKQAETQLLKINAELTHATRLKDEFLSNMSHELRTPLNAVLGMSEALQEGIFAPLNEQQRHAIDIVEQSGKHLLALINDILDLSKIEADKLELQRSPASIRSLCESSLYFVQQQALQKQIQLTVEVPPQLPDITVDERRIRQVLINLLNNAVKFTPEGGRVQLVAQGEPQDAPQFLCLSVLDTGIGIAPDSLDKLFQPFVQIDSRLNRRYAGTGLGLALVRRLLELHGGTVTVTSQLHQGSCFTVRLPYGAATTPEPARYLTTYSAPMPTDNAYVLIIEDSIAAADQISRYLQEHDMQAIVHTQGEGVVEKAIQIQPALIILDILLPDLSGWDVLQQLKRHPQTQSIPVVVLSVVDERTRGLALGASEYLVKPITRTQLQTVLDRLQHRVDLEPSPASRNTLPDQVSQSVPPLILLAEDNEMNVATLSSYLEGLGYRLIYAENGQEAIAQTRKHLPNVILMDIQMPGIDGLEAIRLIRSDRRFSHLPIIALTALAMSGDRERCLEAGADYYLAKPIQLKQLKKTLQKILNPNISSI